MEDKTLVCEDCGKEFASIGECKRFINFMNEGY